MPTLVGVSTQPQGPGWWEASNGSWYPPELHPDYQAPPPPPPPPPGARTTVTIPARERAEWWALAGAALLIIGSFMKWATAGPFSVDGTQTDGWLTVVAGGAAASCCWKQLYLPAAAAAGVGLALVLWKFARIDSLGDDSIFTVSPGTGLYVCAAGGGICVVRSTQQWWRLRKAP